MFVETPSNVVSPSIGKPDSVDEMDNVGNVSICEYNGMLQYLQHEAAHRERSLTTACRVHDHTIHVVRSA